MKVEAISSGLSIPDGFFPDAVENSNLDIGHNVGGMKYTRDFIHMSDDVFINFNNGFGFKSNSESV